MRLFLILLIGKIIKVISSILNIGSGSTWPGNLALMIDKNIIKNLIDKNKNLKIIVVAGTNGKTTTTSLIKHIIKNLGFKVFSNSEGANLLNGIASSLINNSNLSGLLDFENAIFETDEFSFPLLLKQVTPDAVIILNLFRDQLDRYGEVNTIGLRWFSALQNLPRETMLIINGDDPYLHFKSKELLCQKIYFGVKENLMKLKNLPHDVDFTFCPNCGTMLDYISISYSHLGDYECKKCGFIRKNISYPDMEIDYPMKGLYNVYNTNAVLMLFKYYFKIDLKKVIPFLKIFQPVFGRQEEIEYKNKKIFLLLSKNPAGFNQSLKSVAGILKNKKANFLIVLNDRIPDGRDVSWIWDVDFETIISKAKNIFISGDRAYDMAIRLKYEGTYLKRSVLLRTVLNLKISIDKALELTSSDEQLFVLPTYSAMLEVRKVLLGRSLL